MKVRIAKTFDLTDIEWNRLIKAAEARGFSKKPNKTKVKKMLLEFIYQKLYPIIRGEEE